MTAPAPRLISVDWGTTSLRCYLVSAAGGIMGLHTSPEGIMSVEMGRFGATLEEAVTPWLRQFGPLPIVMSGMIGSRQGWHEAPYRHCPVTLDDLRQHLTTITHEGLPPVRLVPGIDTRNAGGIPDVIRGEECQVFGALAERGITSGTFVLPGTHSKWVTARDNAITGFRTYMTGEVFSALKNHTILGRLMSGSHRSADAFARGIAAAQGGMPGDLLHTIFSARTLALFGDLPEADVESYLSGLLIGAEIGSARTMLEGPADASIFILGEDTLSGRYRDACAAMGLGCRIVDADSIVHAHLALLGSDTAGADANN